MEAMASNDDLSTLLPPIIFILCLCALCCKSDRVADDPANDGMGALTATTTPEEELESRRTAIEQALIIRKVVQAKQDVPPSDVRPDNNDSNNSSGGSGGSSSSSNLMGTLAKSERMYSSFVSALVTTRNKSSSSMIQLSEPLEEPTSASAAPVAPTKSSSVVRLHRRKSNIIARTMSKMMRGKPSDEEPTTCDVCLMNYEVGEDVAFSPNDACVHHFHKECITDWLLRNPNCPLCRNDYCAVSGGANVGGGANAV
jgi:hypothetical protein